MTQPNTKYQIPNTSSAGFTLIELLVVVFIMVTISTISIANYRSGERSRSVALAADAVINALRLGQNFALSGKQITATSCANKSAKSYRLDFSSSNDYVLYAEDNCSNPLFEIQRFTLPHRTRMKSGELKLNGTPVTTLSIKFDPPFSKTTASADAGAYVSFTTASVGVEFLDASNSKIIRVDGVSGRVGE